MCDERMCGPQFSRCAGANRRRAGIETDIARDQSFELCKIVDADPWASSSSSEEEEATTVGVVSGVEMKAEDDEDEDSGLQSGVMEGADGQQTDGSPG